MQERHRYTFARGKWGRPIGVLLGTAAVLLVTAFLTYRSVSNLRDSERQVAHTYEVLNEISLALGLAHEAEAAQRGYLLTHEPEYVQTLDRDIASALARADRLIELTASNPDLNARARAFRQQLQERLERLAQTIGVARAGDLEQGRALVAEGGGTRLMEAVAATGQEIVAEERRLLAVRAERSAESARIVGLSFASTVVVILALLALVARAVVREDRIRQAVAVELEHRVEQRTAELSEANAELQAFAHSVAHDLRAPLRNMHGFAVALLEDYGSQIDEPGRTYLERIVRGATRLDALIQDLLAYSRLTRSQIDLERVDLDVVMQRVLQEMEAEINARKARLHIEQPLPQVAAHPPTLGQVLTNLVSNALKFSAPGVEPRVRVKSVRDGDKVRISVQDNGIGIEARHQERIFGVFERLHGQDVYPGTGIGLAIVRKGVERMGGKVGVISEIGSGSEFWIELQSADAS